MVSSNSSVPLPYQFMELRKLMSRRGYFFACFGQKWSLLTELESALHCRLSPMSDEVEDGQAGEKASLVQEVRVPTSC